MLPAPDTAGVAPPARRRWEEDVGLVLWPSFLVASIETMAFFATFDPLALYDHAEVLREAFAPRVFGYSVGFFFFWSLTASASALTLFLARSGRTPTEGSSP